jgi:signal transduction histidine kinase
VTHGPEGVPIKVRATVTDNVFVLSVANGGAKIPEAMLPNLFMPFERDGDRPSREGLGLGLLIASEIAAGHGGTLTVASRDD